MALRRNIKPSTTSPHETPFRILDAETGATLAHISEWQGGREYAFETMLLLAAAPYLLEACEEIKLIIEKYAATWSGRPTKEDFLGMLTIVDTAIAKAWGE